MSEGNRNNGENDPIRLWQAQPREEITMTSKLIRQRAQELHARTRRELFGNLSTIPITAAISCFGFLHTHDLVFRTFFVVAAVWAALGQYLLHRGMWAAPLPEHSAMMPGLEYYRREIERRRNLLGRFLQWSFGPIVLSVGALVVLLTGMARNIGRFGAALPFAMAVVIWIVVMFAIRSRHQRELKREIEYLNEIERASA